MKFLTSRVVVSAIASFIAFAIVPAIATTPEADFKTVTSKAYVDSLISNNDISGHKVNGAPLSNAASYFYGEGVGAADTATKTVSIPSITGTPAVGQVIVVKPATTNTSSTININLNNTAAYGVLYRGSSSNIPKDVWTAYVPSIFVLDETSGGTKYWRYVGTSPVAMTWSATETTASNAYSTTFDGTTNNWPAADENRYVKGDSFAQGLALKQNRITTNLVSFNDTPNGATYNVPALVSYGTGTNNADGILGNKIGIVGYENIGDDLGDYIEVGMDNYVPTVYAVAAALSAIWAGMPSQWHALSWVVSGDDGANRTNAINAYNTTFGTGTNNWAGNANDLINGKFLANSLALKQNKIPAGTSGEILTYSGTAGQLGTPWGVLSSIGSEDLGAMEFYSTTFDGTDGNWATSSAGKLITTNILAEGLALKQMRISSTGSNYIYNETTNPTADGSVVTTTGTYGLVAQRGIATAPTRDNSGNLTNDSWIPTMGAVESMVSGSDISSHKVNGQALSNNQITLYGTSDTAANVSTKRVKLYDYSDPDDPTLIQMDALVPGTVIVVKPENTHTGGTTIQMIAIENISGDRGKGVRYRTNENGEDQSIPYRMAPTIWKKNTPSVWLFDGTYWRFVAGGDQVTEWDSNTHPAAINAYSTTFIGNTANSWATRDQHGLIDGEFLANSLALKQNRIPAQASGAPVTIPTYPAYGESDGAIGKMYLDTSSLYTTDNTHFPSSKLVATTLGLYVQKRDAWNMDETNEWLGTISDGAGASVSGLYLIPGLVDSGTQWAKDAMIYWSDTKTVPTMDTLANSLAGLYDAVGDLVGNQIIDYDETSLGLLSASVTAPSQIEYTGARTLGDGNQLFWLPLLDKNGVQEATRLLESYSTNKIAPSMDELAYALDGVLQTHETTSEWQAVLNYYGLREMSLFELADLISRSDAKAILLNRSGYLQTFAPTLEALMNESYGLYQLIDTKQNVLPAKSTGNAAPIGNQAVVLNATGNPSNVYTTAGKNLALTAKSGAQMVMNYVDGTTAPATFASSQGLSEANVKAALVSLELLRDVYTTIDANKQQVIPETGKYINSTLDTVEIRDYTNREVKGEEVVTSTNMAGAVGKRQIFEAGATYTNDAATNIQIATIGAVMENTFTKVCVEYAPGSTQNDSTCWLWQFVNNAANCIAVGDRCSGDRDCCSGYCGDGRCAADAQETTCAAAGDRCSGDRDCCSGNCVSGLCSTSGVIDIGGGKS